MKRASGVDEQLCQAASLLAPLNHPNCIPYHPSDQLENVKGFNIINIITLTTGIIHYTDTLFTLNLVSKQVVEATATLTNSPDRVRVTIFKEFTYMCDMWLLNRATFEMDKPSVIHLVVSTYLLLLVLLLLLIFFALISYTFTIQRMLVYHWGMRLI